MDICQKAITAVALARANATFEQVRVNHSNGSTQCGVGFYSSFCRPACPQASKVARAPSRIRMSAIFGIAGHIAAIVVLTPGYQLFQAANNTAAPRATGRRIGRPRYRSSKSAKRPGRHALIRLPAFNHRVVPRFRVAARQEARKYGCGVWSHAGIPGFIDRIDPHVASGLVAR